MAVLSRSHPNLLGETMLQDPATKDFSVPSPEECQDLFTNAPIGVFTVTQEGRLLSANPAIARMLGYETPGVIMEQVPDFPAQVFADALDRENFFNKLEKNRQVESFECRFTRRDASIFWASMNVWVFRDQAGQISHYQGLVLDITQQKKAEPEPGFTEYKEAFRTLAEKSAVSIMHFDSQGRVDFVNEWHITNFAFNRLGKDFFLGKTVYELPGLVNAGIADEVARIFQGDTVELHEVYFPALADGRPGWVSIRGVPVFKSGRIAGGILIRENITEHKRNEEALRKKIVLLEAFLDNTPDFMSIKNPDLSPVRYNKTGLELLGMSPEQVEGKKCYNLLGREKPCEDCVSLEAVNIKKPVARERYVPELKKYLSCRANPIISENGEVEYAVELIRDITARKQMEKALQQSREYYRTIFETSGAAQVIIEEDTTISLANSRFAELVGYSREEIEGKRTWTEFVHPDDLGWMKEQHHLRRRDPGAAAKEYECRFIDAQGGIRHVLLFVDLIPNTSQSVASLLDITERKHYEERLKYLSLHDQLTGLYNRAYLENELKRLNKSREHPVTIMSIDVDGLKAINDMFGHEQGDKILKLTADILQEIFRASDILGRAGGDEFVALLPGTDAQAGSKIVQRIRSRVEKYNREKQDTQLPLSLSTGMAVAEDRSRDLFSVFKEADDLMYRDKLNKDVTARSQIMRTIMAAMEERDFITHGHARRLEDLCRLLGESAGLSEKQLSDLALLAQVHDLGKVGIPDHVLFKDGPLTDEEWEIMYQHSEKGYRIARASTDLADVADLILKHHERWDGEGYPLGLEGEEIPIECRILAIADAYDAMTSDRPYRKALARKDAIAELKRCSGTQFDQYLVDKSIEIIQQFNSI